MKSVRYLSALFALAGVIGAAGAALADPKTVVLTNNTSYALNSLYASPSDDSSWNMANNLLNPGQTISPGQTASVTFDDDTGHCHYDLMAILYGAAQFAYQYEVDVCEGGYWYISPPGP